MLYYGYGWSILCFFFFQAEDGIRDLVRSRGLGDVYKRQLEVHLIGVFKGANGQGVYTYESARVGGTPVPKSVCLLYTSDAADERSSVDLGGRRIL